ncbi:uncharacterized protein KD926_009519 [Aspergillus affinis]|uniref:uncharacterized protein n=1 Tax=Aspergillus affinis TaxID=1070780 RepID=UPI0022FE3AE9|nr:uncharacterized protein KD926_009519 [Aspergillus affinis]KAI9039376.1 hypothetical protein KD926_009519 [Aspergillus affinis]
MHYFIGDCKWVPRDSINFTDGYNYGGIILPDSAPADEFRPVASARSDRIYDNYVTLHRILQRHEERIRKLWPKKNRGQRLEIILDAWPDMPEIHRPDFAAFREVMDYQTHKHKGWFVWPYTKQEDLRGPKALPLLLNSRGRHVPSHFAAADWTCHGLNGMTENSRDYGKLMSWDDHPDAFHWFLSSKKFLPGEGLLVLEAQDGLLDFLVKCSLRILHDIARSAIISDIFPNFPEPQFQDEGEITGFESLSVMAAEAPYRVPAKLNILRIESLLRARASAAEDHLWALREGPEYFANVLLEEKEHRPEWLEDVNGNKHPLLREEEIIWRRIMGWVVGDAYIMVEMFSELTRQAGELAALHDKYASCISPAEEYELSSQQNLFLIAVFIDLVMEVLHQARSGDQRAGRGGDPPPYGAAFPASIEGECGMERDLDSFEWWVGDAGDTILAWIVEEERIHYENSFIKRFFKTKAEKEKEEEEEEEELEKAGKWLEAQQMRWNHNWTLNIRQRTLVQRESALLSQLNRMGNEERLMSPRAMIEKTEKKQKIEGELETINREYWQFERDESEKPNALS